MLRFLGYPGKDGNLLPLTGQLDEATTWAIGLFNAVVTGAEAHDPAATEIRRDMINDPRGPRWVQLGDLSTSSASSLRRGRPRRWGTDWVDAFLQRGAPGSRQGGAARHPVDPGPRRPASRKRRAGEFDDLRRSDPAPVRDRVDRLDPEPLLPDGGDRRSPLRRGAKRDTRLSQGWRPRRQ